MFLLRHLQEEEDGSDEDSVSSMTVEELPVPPPQRPARPAANEEDSDRDSDPAFVSPMDEVKCVEQPTAVTTANLHEASRSVVTLAGFHYYKQHPHRFAVKDSTLF